MHELQVEGWGSHKVSNTPHVRGKNSTITHAKCVLQTLQPRRYSTNLKYDLQEPDSYATLLTIREKSNNNLRANNVLTYQRCASLTLSSKARFL